MREDLRRYSQFLKKIRQFFDQQGLIEVQTPCLLAAPSTDVYIDSLAVRLNRDIDQEQVRYLHTSPELEMKKLLSRGSGDIYQITQVFRDNEQGQHNSNEFAMLEYYRLGFDIHALMDDISQLLLALGIRREVTRLSYAQAFEQLAGIDILNLGFDELKHLARQQGLNDDFYWIEDLQTLLFVQLIEPKLDDLGVCFIYDYPAQQSALARVEGKLAHRFELYIDGLEVANGYDELQTQVQYRDCFKRELSKRAQLGKSVSALDQGFLQQLETPLPACSGVAIGLKRLLANSA